MIELLGHRRMVTYSPYHEPRARLKTKSTRPKEDDPYRFGLPAFDARTQNLEDRFTKDGFLLPYLSPLHCEWTRTKLTQRMLRDYLAGVKRRIQRINQVYPARSVGHNLD